MAKRKVQIEHEPIVGVFAARLREVRLSRGLTQADLANRAGSRSRSAIAAIAV